MIQDIYIIDNDNDIYNKLNELFKTEKNFRFKNVKENEFLNHFLQYATIDKLTRPMVEELIDSILVHKNGNITINFKFTDAYEEILEYIDEVKRRMLAEIA